MSVTVITGHYPINGSNIWFGYLLSVKVELTFLIHLSLDKMTAIIWTNIYPIHWRIYAAKGEDELKCVGFVYHCHAGCFTGVLSTANARLFQSWWRHQMETFSALLAICAGNSPVLGEFPTQRPVTRSFDVFFDLRLNKRLSKQWWGWWCETLSRPIWRHSNGDSEVTLAHLPSG